MTEPSDTTQTRDRVMIWDPRKMISGPFTTCPKCGVPELGTLMVSRRSWTRRCRACMHDRTERLPRLAKRIIYLDQMVFSNIAKALDPVWRGTRATQDPFWLELFDQIERLVKLQLAVCPSSPIHDRESVVTPYADVLKRLREYLSTGVEFDSDTIILQRQLHHALDAVLAGSGIDYIRGGAREVLHGDVDAWSDRFQITVNFPTGTETVEQVRRSRNSSGNAFEQLWARWSAEPGRTFNERYEHERCGVYYGWVQLYNEHLRRFALVSHGLAPIDDDIIDPRMSVMVVLGLLRRLQDEGLELPQAHQKLAEFFNSEPARAAPANDISSLLMAALARKAGAGQKRPPNRGSWNDIMAISAYLPYSDAVFIDDQFAGLLREEPLRSRLDAFQQRVFSNRSREAFLDWLRGIEGQAPPEHVTKVAEVYGDTWLTPFRSVLEHERERRKKR